ncbi:hypothetical protein M407DRAFT_223240 [Tulasnella calospora MUT 4182]|uniref:Uncharacterized protein n=1 Tax=Tulasnella calospora MUT 4182 TaxID=1051891 RepID=A0A0C3KCT0_9AGAM|nr:hypothetical protein M407DRAFT_223240 [Tulasnella calospora MUT 4182]
MPPKKKDNKKKSDTRDAEDAIEAEQAVEKTTGALGALQNRGLSKDPPAIATRKSTRNAKAATTQVDPASPLTTNPPTRSPSTAAPLLPTMHENDAGADEDGGANEDTEEESGDVMKDLRGMEDVQQPDDCKYQFCCALIAILVQLDLVHMDHQDMAVESVYATIEKKVMGSGSTIGIQDLVANVKATPPMSARAFMLHRTALFGDGKVAIGSVTEVLAGTAPLLAIKPLSTVTLEEKGGVYHTVLWYRPIQGEQPVTVAKLAPTHQPHRAQSESVSNEPNHGFHQSKLDPEVLEWLRVELEGPTKPLPGAGSLREAWEREKLYRLVKSNADEHFKYKQSYKINIEPYDGILFKVDALQDICFLRHTNCAKSTTGFANAEKNPEMARWLNEEARAGDTDFSSWSISRFWAEASKRAEIADKKALSYQEKKGKEKQVKGKEKPKERVKKPRQVVEVDEQEEFDSDDLDAPQGSSKYHGRK